ncbi:Hypothetical protein PBC10988_14160 [Planctomycetales bacterium 10988]|nr:Hypothetical protein PBC10988_14160 [Planctomycetales bacterium 10988]
MKISTPDAFLEVLEKSNLLEPLQLARARRTVEIYAERSSPELLARSIVQEGWLTTWQTQQLLAGVHRLYLGRYILEDRIGQGGMGTVFRARQLPMDRTVAVKVLSPELLENQSAISRFGREVRAIAALNHPNIVTAYDAGRLGDTFFLVMEYVDGEDLTGWQQNYGQLPIAWVCDCIRQAALALEYAHQQGMIHRDVKPGNLLVASPQGLQGKPLLKLSDMGLAHVLQEINQHSGQDPYQEERMLGTLNYVAPEQIQSQTTADPRMDIFSLGCTLFKLITGELPFSGRNATEKLLSRTQKDAPLASGLREEVPVALDAILIKMLQRNPDQRYQTCAEIATDLEPLCTPQSASQVSVLEEEDATFTLNPREIRPDYDASLSNLGAVLENEAIAAIDLFISEQEEEASRVLANEQSQPKRRAHTWAIFSIAAVLFLSSGVLLYGYFAEPRISGVFIQWPISERQSSRLIVNGQEWGLEGEAGFTIPLDPGKHHLVASRQGYRTYQTETTVLPGEQVAFAPHWEALELKKEIKPSITPIQEKKDTEQPPLFAHAPWFEAIDALEQTPFATETQWQELRRELASDVEKSLSKEEWALLARFPTWLDELPPQEELQATWEVTGADLIFAKDLSQDSSTEKSLSEMASEEPIQKVDLGSILPDTLTWKTNPPQIGFCREGGTWEVWDLAQNTFQQSEAAEEGQVFWSAFLSKAPQRYLTASEQGLQLWQTQPLSLLKHLPTATPQQQGVISPCGNWLATSDSSGMIALWKIDEAGNLQPETSHALSRAPLQLAFTSDSKALWMTEPVDETHFKKWFWELESGEVTDSASSFEGTSLAVHGVLSSATTDQQKNSKSAFHELSMLTIIRNSQGVIEWGEDGVSSEKRKAILENDSDLTFTIRPDGRRLVFAGQKELSFHDLGQDVPLRQVKFTEELGKVQKISYSEQGRYLLVLFDSDWLVILRLQPATIRHWLVAWSTLQLEGSLVLEQEDHQGKPIRKSITTTDELPSEGFRIRELDLAFCSLLPADLTRLRNITSLESLTLHSTPLVNQDLEALSGMLALKRLDLSETLVNDEGLRYLTNLSKLKELDLSNTKITENAFESLREIKSLEVLNLAGTQYPLSAIAKLQKELKSTELLLEKQEEEKSPQPDTSQMATSEEGSPQ